MPTVAPELVDQLTAAVHGLLTGRAVSPVVLPEEYPDDEFRQLTGFINKFAAEYEAFATAMRAVANGELGAAAPKGRMAVAGSLKALLANLKNLTWAATRIAAGDFSQRVDFMGEFSAAFNKMATDLKEAFERIESQKIAMEREIAERELTEQDLRRGEERLQAVLDAGVHSASGMHCVGDCLIAPLPDGLTDAVLDLVRERVVRLVHSASARAVIVDVSAVRLLDSAACARLVEMERVIALLGAKTVFVGFQPGVVSSLMDLDVDFSGIEGAVNLEDAFDRLGFSPPALREDSTQPGLARGGGDEQDGGEGG
ncbi:MAG: HAMP domain-containing protein [Desulfovibrionaceae bacterium]|nr:HAMP domain-containing protein [Desulfovibrionaceae bacterium]MBF0512820.1 HAMP domain-containing protein [Desulfovibrionaceae bacterium]